MSNTNLQELSKAYAEGKIEQEGYRKRRTELLDSITSPLGIEQYAPSNIENKENKTDFEKESSSDELEEQGGNKNSNNDTASSAPLSNRSPVIFLLIMTAVLLTFVYILTII